MKREYLYATLLVLAGIVLVVFLFTDYTPLGRTVTNGENRNIVVTGNQNATATEINGNQNTNTVAVNGNAHSNTPNVNTTTVVNTNTSMSTSVTLTATVIAQHGTATDCWLVVNGQVYDITPYLPMHPKGSAAVVPYCGKPDGTAAFETKGSRGEDHSSMAYAELERYRLGAVNATVTVQ